MTDTTNIDADDDQKMKEAYFTASQGQLIWQRFKKNKSALAGAWVLIFLILSGIFAPFLTPYDATIAGRDKEYLNGAPQVPSFCDDNGCSMRPFIYTTERTRSIKTNFRWVTETDTSLEGVDMLSFSPKACHTPFWVFRLKPIYSVSTKV